MYYEITFRGIESPNQINSNFYQTSNLFSIVTSVQINSNYGIMPFSTYNVSARAVNEVGPGPFSNEVLVQTVADGKCFDSITGLFLNMSAPKCSIHIYIHRYSTILHIIMQSYKSYIHH